MTILARNQLPGSGAGDTGFSYMFGLSARSFAQGKFGFEWYCTARSTRSESPVLKLNGLKYTASYVMSSIPETRGQQNSAPEHCFRAGQQGECRRLSGIARTRLESLRRSEWFRRSAGDALWTVLRPCGIVLMTGAALGLVGAISIGPTLASQLHGVGPRDAVTLLITPLLMGLVGVVAAVVAGSRVLRADPAATLRSE